MDYMFNACSTTARRGALDWAKVFEETNLPVFERLYESVKNGSETRRSLEFNGRSTYREDLAKELKEIDEQEIWRAGTCLAIHALPTHARLTNSQARSCARSAPTRKTRRGRAHGWAMYHYFGDWMESGLDCTFVGAAGWHAYPKSSGVVAVRCCV